MKLKQRSVKRFLFAGVLWGLFSFVPPLNLDAQELSKGQWVYVPIYSHIYYGEREQAFPLTGTLSIRNTDPVYSITLLSVDFYDTNGKLMRKYISKPVVLGPMASTRFIVKASDRPGGSGANFLVRWKADTEVNPPLLEGIMIGASGQQGISFTSRGQVIRERPPE